MPTTYKVARSRLDNYSILESFGQRSQYISIKIPLHKQSENPWVCYYPRRALAQDFMVHAFMFSLHKKS